jgi:hypothetical protein
LLYKRSRKARDYFEEDMITNRMRRMSKRRQKIELSRQARLVARAVDLHQVATDPATLAAAPGRQSKSSAVS